MREEYIYFDHASTSHPKPDVLWLSIKNYLENIGANPGRSAHSLSRQAYESVYETKRLLAALFHVSNPDLFHFTANATAGLNLILKGLLKEKDHVITTNLEHNSVLRPLEKLKNTRSISYDIVNADNNGEFELSDFEKKFTGNTKLVIVNHGSNVLGTISPILEIAELCKKHQIKLLIDAAQTAGLIDINLEQIPTDFMAFTGHKSLLGPSGIGGVYIKDPFSIDTLQEGGTGNNSHSLLHPETPTIKFEAGTSNYLGIVGLGAALNYLFKNDFISLVQKELQLTEYCLNQLAKMKNIIIYGPSNIKNKIPVISFNVTGLYPGEVSYLLDVHHKIMLRPGLQCAPLIHKTLGTFPHGTIRFSLGHTNTKAEVDYLLDALTSLTNSWD